MSMLFSFLNKNKLLSDWAEMLDWYFDEKKFDPELWVIGDTNSYTSRIKKAAADSIIIKDEKKCLKFYDSFKAPKDTTIRFVFITNSKKAFSKELIRHIRNGIAHGRTNCRKATNSRYFIEIFDYENGGKQQSAYIYMPLDFLLDLYKCYTSTRNRH